MKKYKLGEEPNDLPYWLSKTKQERIAALEELRDKYIKLFMNRVNPGFQRVFKITKRAQD